MTPIVHNYSNQAGQTTYWDTADNKVNYLQNIQNPEKQQRLEHLGYIDAVIEYTFNRDGFRTHEFNQPFDIVCFGCSFTMGTGVHVVDTWPTQLEKITGLKIANLGHAGSSNDTTFRFAEYYLKILKPQYAIWQQTDSFRLELLDDYIPLSQNILVGDTANPCANDYFIKTWFTSKSNYILNCQKNTLAFKQLCNELGIKCLILPRCDVPFIDLGRDLQHPGRQSYQLLAERINEELFS